MTIDFFATRLPTGEREQAGYAVPGRNSNLLCQEALDSTAIQVSFTTLSELRSELLSELNLERLTQTGENSDTTYLTYI